jgi:hypothetical protein
LENQPFDLCLAAPIVFVALHFQFDVLFTLNEFERARANRIKGKLLIAHFSNRCGADNHRHAAGNHTHLKPFVIGFIERDV